MANVATTPEAILKIIRTDVVFGEMRAIFDVADSKQWFHTDTWDKKSFGHVEGKKQIVFKTTYEGVANIINSRKREQWISSAVVRAKGNDEPKIQTMGKPHIYLKIGAQTIKFEGTKDKGGGGGKKKVNPNDMTMMQELGSAWVFYQALNKGKTWSDWTKLKNDPDVKGELSKIWAKFGDNWVESGDEWAQNFYAQQKALLSKLGGTACCQFDEYTHSNKYTLPGMKSNSFMNWITEQIPKMGVTGKDNWNPADIWLIQSTFEKQARDTIQQMLDDVDPVEIKREKVNSYMRALFQEKKIFGISLKKVTKQEAKVVYFNHHEDFFTKNWKGEGSYGGKGTDAQIMSYHSAICKCGKKKDGGDWTMETQDMIWYVHDTNKDSYKFQIKGNNSTGFSGLKYEPTAEGHGEARLGKATVELVLENLKKHGVSDKFNKESSSYPKTADEFINNKGSNTGQTWLQMIQCLFTNGVDMGAAKDAQEAYDNILAVFDEANGSPHHANAKLQEIRWLCAFFAINKKDRFATDMVWMAMKAGRSYGAYAKIY